MMIGCNVLPRGASSGMAGTKCCAPVPHPKHFESFLRSTSLRSACNAGGSATCTRPQLGHLYSFICSYLYALSDVKDRITLHLRSTFIGLGLEISIHKNYHQSDHRSSSTIIRLTVNQRSGRSKFRSQRPALDIVYNTVRWPRISLKFNLS